MRENLKLLLVLTFGKPRDIASSLTEGIYVSLFRSENSKVVHYRSSGEIQQEIQFDSSKQPIYADPKSIAINKNGDVCVVDSERLVTVVNSKGELWRCVRKVQTFSTNVNYNRQREQHSRV